MAFAQIGLLLFLLQADTSSATTKQPPHWYEQVTGVVAIPAALIGCAYSYFAYQEDAT
jgi:hypothetical protein